MSESSLTSCVCFSVSVREKEKAKRYHDVSTQTTMNRKFVKIRSFILSSFCHLCSHRAKCVTFARSIIQLQFMTIYNQIDVQMAWALPGLRSSSFPCNLKNELPSRSFHLLLCLKLKVLTYLGSTKNFTSDEFKILKWSSPESGYTSVLLCMKKNCIETTWICGAVNMIVFSLLPD